MDSPREVERFDAELDCDTSAPGVPFYGVEHRPNPQGPWVRYSDHVAEVAALKERLEASERDAARYRWLRERRTTDDLSVESLKECSTVRLDASDAAIDAALARGGQG